jgi:hypothetical protein
MGTWKIEQFSSGVVKVGFDPQAYPTNEQVSNAVIGKRLNQFDKGTAILTDSDKR